MLNDQVFNSKINRPEGKKYVDAIGFNPARVGLHLTLTPEDLIKVAYILQEHGTLGQELAGEILQEYNKAWDLAIDHCRAGNPPWFPEDLTRQFWLVQRIAGIPAAYHAMQWGTGNRTQATSDPDQLIDWIRRGVFQQPEGDNHES
jgi:hypothetical protein